MSMSMICARTGTPPCHINRVREQSYKATRSGIYLTCPLLKPRIILPESADNLVPFMGRHCRRKSGCPVLNGSSRIARELQTLDWEMLTTLLAVLFVIVLKRIEHAGRVVCCPGLHDRATIHTGCRKSLIVNRISQQVFLLHIPALNCDMAQSRRPSPLLPR